MCRNKGLIRRLLTRAEVPIAEGEAFPTEAFDDALAYATRLGWPVVVKPSDLRSGKGVGVGIRSEDQFRSAWHTSVEAMAKEGISGIVLVERDHDGIDVRVYIVGGHAVAGVVRVPAYVVGDGQRTVTDLVAAKNRERSMHPHLRRMPITLDRETNRHLDMQGLTRQSIPQKGQMALLRGASNLSRGGESIDVTDRLPQLLADMAIRAVGVIPGLDVAGVDFLMPNVECAAGAVALEVNASANISMHHFPVAGEPRDVAGAIVDQSIETYS